MCIFAPLARRKNRDRDMAAEESRDMSRLRIYDEDRPRSPIATWVEPADIARELAVRGVRFEQWQAAAPVEPGADPDEVIAAYRADIDRLMGEHGYRSVDVVSIHPQHPDRTTLRQKFRSEHVHGEDEVRFFVAGAGLFTLHIEDRVFEVLCEKGDLIGVPAGTRHWFDMGESPYFVAIRLFTNPDGWVARFTGADIAARFPDFGPSSSCPDRHSHGSTL
jgi:1,2-dihydroxy-3-keto-5-methylthiopentene dioxygenase